MQNHLATTLRRLAAVLLASVITAQAATYYVDTNGVTGGFFNAPSGSGNMNGTVYSTSSVGTATTTTLSTASHSIVVGTDNVGYGFTGTLTFDANKSMQSLTIGAASGNITFDRTSTNGPSAKQLTNNSTSGNITFSATVRDYDGSNKGNVTQNGGGVMTLALSTNSYTGVTTIYSGSISVSSLANGGSTSGIGQSTNAATNLRFDGGALTYTGGITSTDRNFTIYDGGATINASGTGTLAWSGTAAYDTVDADRSLTLGGTYVNNNTFSGDLADNGSGKLSLTKEDGGRWRLTGNNTYTGKTIVNAGQLRVDSSSSLGGNPGSFVTDQLTLNGGTLYGFNGSLNGLNTNRGITVGPGGGALQVTQGSTFTIDGIIAGEGNLRVDGFIPGTTTSTFELSNANTFTGTTKITDGILILSHADALQNSPFDTASTAGDSLNGLQITSGTSLKLGGLIGSNGLQTRFADIGGNRGGYDDVDAITLNVANGKVLTYSGNIDSDGAGGSKDMSLTKTGSGTQILSGSNYYTGATTVSGGTLIIDSTGSLAAGSTVSVNSGTLIVDGTVGGSVSVAAGATLSGSGTITGNTTISGTHSPGNSPGIDIFGGNLEYVNGGTPDPAVIWELAVNNNTPRGVGGYDGIDVGGTLTFTDQTTLTLVFDATGSNVDWTDPFWNAPHLGAEGWLVYSVAGDDVNNLISPDKLILTVSNWEDGSGLSQFFDTVLPKGYFELTQVGNDIYLGYGLIPEPSTAILAGLGLAGLMLRRRRR